MREDQLVALVSLLLALTLAVMRLRGELSARRHLRKQNDSQPTVKPSDTQNDIERFR
jgi:hypothetical protein